MEAAMRVVNSLEEMDPARGCVLSVGVFDGFHLGHRRILEVALSLAKELDTPLYALSFQPHPRKVLHGEELDLITSVDHRQSLLERAGVDTTVLIEFTPEFAALSAQRFVEDVALGRLGAKAMVLGRTAGIGSGRSADANRIAEIGAGLGVDVRIVAPVIVGGERVSSTRVREAIQAGDLALAEELLGRRVSVFGTVVRGHGIGRKLGFPTANVDVHREVRPPFGVYATWAVSQESRIPAVTNVGFRPTFTDDGGTRASGVRPDRLVETHLLDRPGADFYDTCLEIEFVKKLRDERRFGTDAELAEQIARDVEAARRALARDVKA
jgi:riboflavin kinase/FMN adenylyltransferase